MKKPEEFYKDFKHDANYKPELEREFFINCLKKYHAQFVPTDEEFTKKLIPITLFLSHNERLWFNKGFQWARDFVREEPKKEERGDFVWIDEKNPAIAGNIAIWQPDKNGKFIKSETGEIHEIK